jgi:YfiH family protein
VAAPAHIELDLPGAHVRFTTRAGGVSAGPYASLNLGLLTDDDPAAVAENRRRAADGGGPPAWGRQVHGTRVLSVDTATAADAPDADGIATATPGLAALVLTADCLPVALATPDAIAMVHAGWRGLAAGVLDEGVAALRDLGATGPVRAAVGPGAGGCCYEVGDEVREVFADVPEARDGRRIDLARIARARLQAAGAVEVHLAGLCTMCDARFFSHRRDHGVTGRQGGVAWLSS